jgi:hypothetical protein
MKFRVQVTEHQVVEINYVLEADSLEEAQAKYEAWDGVTEESQETTDVTNVEMNDISEIKE